MLEDDDIRKGPIDEMEDGTLDLAWLLRRPCR